MLALVFTLALPFIAPHLSRSLVQNLTAHTKQPRNSIFAQTFYTDTTKSMALAEEAKRVAAEFDFDQDHVRKAVNEFIREMGTSATIHKAPMILTRRR